MLGTIARLSPLLEQPNHLAPLIGRMDSDIAAHIGQRLFWFSVPPRHWKTFTIRHAIAEHIRCWPNENAAYVSHTQPFANKQARAIRKLVAKAGFRFSLDANRQDEWELRDFEGGFAARGINAFGSGLGFRLVVIDDPFKTRQEAESQGHRDAVWDAIQDDILPRLTPDGVIWLVHTRWHEDDAIGRAGKDGWDGKNIPALGGEAENVPLLPHVWGYDYLANIRKKNPRKFASLYQGRPRPRGGSVFHEPTYFEWSERPRQAYRTGYGVDLSYSEKTVAKADWSVSVRLHRVETKDPQKPRFYVVDVQRKQVEAPEFTLVLHSQQSHDPGPMRFYCSGTEKGSGQFIKKKVGEKFKIKTTTADKYQRAQPVAEAWNEGRILVPTGDDRPEWVDDFVDEITKFTGVKDASDDQVDALAGAHDELEKPPSSGGLVTSTSRPSL